jgi:hypothetical protein
MPSKNRFEGKITAVKARIRLIRSFDEVSHAYLGYLLVIDGIVDRNECKGLRIAVGKKAHEKHQFRIGDRITGEAQPVEKPKQEWADFYKVSRLKIICRGDPSEERAADSRGGIAPLLIVYRERGHLRLDPRTYEAKCRQCPWGLVMATEIIVDHWNPDIKKWRYETHCYGPKDCNNYRPGKPRSVPGRKGMIWVDNDYEIYKEDR